MTDPPATKRRILEVSDDPGIRQINAAGCERRGFEVIQASSGDEAMRLYEALGPFAVVMTDLSYHEEPAEPPAGFLRDGIELALAIREKNPAQKIVLHTAASAANVRSRIDHRLADMAILQKPYRLKDLESFLENL